LAGGGSAGVAGGGLGWCERAGRHDGGRRSQQRPGRYDCRIRWHDGKQPAPQLGQAEVVWAGRLDWAKHERPGGSGGAVGHRAGRPVRVAVRARAPQPLGRSDGCGRLQRCGRFWRPRWSSATGGSSGTSSCGCCRGISPVGLFNARLPPGSLSGHRRQPGQYPRRRHHPGVRHFYMHGLYFPPGPTPNDFHGVSMYSSKDLATWKNEGIVFSPAEERPRSGRARIATGRISSSVPRPGNSFSTPVRPAPTDFEQGREVVYATSPTSTASTATWGPHGRERSDCSHSDMSAYADDTGAYVITESGWVYPLADDCHSWKSGKIVLSRQRDLWRRRSAYCVQGRRHLLLESRRTRPAGGAINNFYSTAPAMTGPWTYQGYVAPADPQQRISLQRTWLSQTTWVQPVRGKQRDRLCVLGRSLGQLAELPAALVRTTP